MIWYQNCTNSYIPSTSTTGGNYIYYPVWLDCNTATGCTSSTTNGIIYNSTNNWVYYTPYVDQQQMAAQYDYWLRQQNNNAVACAQQQEYARQQQERVYAEARKSRDEANKRAMALLLEHLTSEQRETFERNGWFIVEGGRSKKTYQINPRVRAGNVTELERGKARFRYCAHAPHDIPEFDNALAQKLMLEVDEDAFLRIANRSVA